MFHRIKSVAVLPDYKLLVSFFEGVTKIYNAKGLTDKNQMFNDLKNEELFCDARVDVGGYGVIWNDDTDISCDELYEKGETVETPFDGLMTFGDATLLWGLSEDTLRKAVRHGKLLNGMDVCRYGKQWIVSTKAMKREYGGFRNE